MADEADVANDYIANEVSRALGRMRQEEQNDDSGSDLCKNCFEKIPEARKSLGFKLCIECAEENERRKSLFADY